MTASQGHLYRRVGLSIEALCMLGLLGLARGHFEIWKGFPLDPSVVLTLGLGVGFIVWSFGTYAIMKARRNPPG